MLTANTYAGDALSAGLQQRIGAGSGILAATMVDMESLDDSSAFGRMSMQQIGSRVAQHGFKVQDVRLTEAMRMDIRQGEFMLSRDTTRILAQDYDAHAVLVGVYSRSTDKVFISVRAIRLDDAAVIAAYEYYLPKDGDVQTLLSGSASGKPAGDPLAKYSRRSKVSGDPTAPGPAVAAPVASNRSAPAPRQTPAPPPMSKAPAPVRSVAPAAPTPAPQAHAVPFEKDAPYIPDSYQAPSGGVPVTP